MSDVTIPEDIREAAIRAFYVEGFPGGDLPTAVMERDILVMIRRAISTERERCAGIAETHPKHRFGGWSGNPTCHAIAAAIRDGSIAAPVDPAQAIRSSHE